MKKGLKRFLIICAAIAVVGLALTVIGFASGGVSQLDKMSAKYDWLQTDPGEMRYMEPENNSKFHSVKVKGDIDVHVIKHQNQGARIGYRENLKAPEAYVKDGVLIVNADNQDKQVTVNFSGESATPVLEVYCKQEQQLDSMDIDIESGDVNIKDVSAKNMNVCSEYGDIVMDGAAFDKGNVKAESGNITCRRVNSQGLKIENQYGDCHLAGNFHGRNHIIMESGDLTIDTNLDESLYNVDARTESGELCIGKYRDTNNECHYRNGSGPHRFQIVSEYGDVNVGFCQSQSNHKNGEICDQNQKRDREHNGHDGSSNHDTNHSTKHNANQ